jgi:hypothetical protein
MHRASMLKGTSSSTLRAIVGPQVRVSYMLIPSWLNYPSTLHGKGRVMLRCISLHWQNWPKLPNGLLEERAHVASDRDPHLHNVWLSTSKTCWSLGPIALLHSMVAVTKTNKLRGLFQSANELYRLSDCHLLAKFNANFCG